MSIYVHQPHKLIPQIESRVQISVTNLSQKYPAHARHWELGVRMYYMMMEDLLKQHSNRLKLADENVRNLSKRHLYDCGANSNYVV